MVVGAALEQPAESRPVPVLLPSLPVTVPVPSLPVSPRPVPSLIVLGPSMPGPSSAAQGKCFYHIIIKSEKMSHRYFVYNY